MPTQDFVVLASTSRQPGVIVSPTVLIPANVLLVIVTANLQLADKLANGLSLSLAVERSDDSGASWHPVVGLGWTSYGSAGYTSGALVNPDPSVRMNPAMFQGQLFRASLTLPQALTVGVTMTVKT